MNDILDRLRSIIVSRHSEEGVTPEEWSGVLSTCIDAAEEIRRDRAFIADVQGSVSRIGERMDSLVASTNKVSEILSGGPNHG